MSPALVDEGRAVNRNRFLKLEVRSRDAAKCSVSVFKKPQVAFGGNDNSKLRAGFCKHVNLSKSHQSFTNLIENMLW